MNNELDELDPIPFRWARTKQLDGDYWLLGQFVICRPYGRKIYGLNGCEHDGSKWVPKKALGTFPRLKDAQAAAERIASEQDAPSRPKVGFDAGPVT
jgi:hypothetical protein